MSEILKNWYWVMPNTILFDKTINAQEKLFFVFISSLCAEKWYCWANNNYFAEKMDLSSISVSRYINLLSKKWYIYIYIDKEKWNKRYIWLDKTIIKNDDTYNQKWWYPIIKNDDTPIIKNDKHNSINTNSINTNIINNNKDIVFNSFINDKTFNSYLEDIELEEEKKNIVYEFFKDRKDRWKKMTKPSLKLFINKMATLWKTTKDYREIIDQAIEWWRMTVYPLKKWFEKQKPSNAHELWTSSWESGTTLKL